MLGVHALALAPWAPPASPEEFRVFEQSSRIALPEDYKSFLRTQNGGNLRSESANAFPLGMDRSDHGYLVTVYAFRLGKSEPCTLPHAWHEDTAWLPRELWPIADDGSGNYVCISLGDADNGSVVYLEHELLSLPETNIGELTEQAGFIRLTKSFTEFLESLDYQP